MWEAIEQTIAAESGQRDVEERKAILKASGHSYAELARLAGVSWRMVKFWIDGQRTSEKIAEAFKRLTEKAS